MPINAIRSPDVKKLKPYSYSNIGVSEKGMYRRLQTPQAYWVERFVRDRKINTCASDKQAIQASQSE